jgi:type VI secretion system protein ImpF
MSRVDLDQALTPSMLDRLIDPDSGGTLARGGYSIEQIIAAVRRDLEELLNTRLGTVTFPPEFPEILRSPVAYGIPDFGSVPSSTTLQQETIGRVIEDTINRFEPRLREVRVNLQGESWGGTQMKVQFEIEARLSIDPYPDISFETIVELTTGCTSIRALKS